MNTDVRAENLRHGDIIQDVDTREEQTVDYVELVKNNNAWIEYDDGGMETVSRRKMYVVTNR